MNLGGAGRAASLAVDMIDIISMVIMTEEVNGEAPDICRRGAQATG
jgi:hypothetical protein